MLSMQHDGDQSSIIALDISLNRDSLLYCLFLHRPIVPKFMLENCFNIHFKVEVQQLLERKALYKDLHIITGSVALEKLM